MCGGTSTGTGVRRLGILSTFPRPGLILCALGSSESRRRPDGGLIFLEQPTGICSSSKDAHVANGSSRSAPAMAVVSSAAVASADCFVFAAGSSIGFSFWRSNPSSTGPLCWLGVLGVTDDVSSLKESPTWDCYWAWCGSLKRQSGTRFALPAYHRKSMSWSCGLRAHLYSFGSRLRLRNSLVSTEQSVTKVKRLPVTYCLKCLMAH